MLMRSPTIYALPGWGFKSTIFNPLSNENFHMVGLDYLQLSSLTMMEIAHSLSDLLPKQTALLGWSFGGLLAIKLAAVFPTKIKKIILLDSQPKLAAAPNWMGIDNSALERFSTGLSQDFHGQMNWFIRLTCYPNQSAIARKLLAQHVLQKSTSALMALLSALLETDLREEYRQLNCDVFHIISEQDAVLPQNAAQLIDLNPGIHVRTISGMGHAGFFTNQEVYIDAINGFIHAK